MSSSCLSVEEREVGGVGVERARFGEMINMLAGLKEAVCLE
jgi:hypothetical protein